MIAGALFLCFMGVVGNILAAVYTVFGYQVDSRIVRVTLSISWLCIATASLLLVFKAVL